MRDGKAGSSNRQLTQKEHWDTVARGWRKWWPLFEQQFRTVSERLIELDSIQPGQRVLDIATGIGEPALTVAQHVGPKGSVIGIDQASRMLSLARARKAEMRIENVDFLEMDAETPDLPRGIFDAVVCRWGLMFFLDVQKALTRYRELLKPVGHFATSVWGMPPQVPLMSIPFGLAQTLLGMPAPAPSSPSMFGITSQALVEALAGAGFRNIQSDVIIVNCIFVSREEFARHMRDVSAPLVAALSSASARKQKEFWRRLNELLVPFAQADGSLLIPNTTICVAGSRGS